MSYFFFFLLFDFFEAELLLIYNLDAARANFGLAQSCSYDLQGGSGEIVNILEGGSIDELQQKNAI